MPEYIVKTKDGNTLFIEADRFQLDGASTPPAYYFYSKCMGSVTTVASIPLSSLVAIVEKSAVRGWGRPITETHDQSGPFAVDICSEALRSFDECLLKKEAPKTETPAVEERIIGGLPSWGFILGNNFVPFGPSDRAKSRAENTLESKTMMFHKVPLSETTPVK